MSQNKENMAHVHSQEPAIMQCTRFITENGMKVAFESDTAYSARKVSQMWGPGSGKHFAIASRKAAELYGLEIISDDINNVDGNTTRFLVVKPSVS